MNAPTLARKAFSVSRLAEFASVTETGMRRLSRPVPPRDLGIIGKANLLERVHAYLAAHPSSSWATAVEAVAGSA